MAKLIGNVKNIVASRSQLEHRFRNALHAQHDQALTFYCQMLDVNRSCLDDSLAMITAAGPDALKALQESLREIDPHFFDPAKTDVRQAEIRKLNRGRRELRRHRRPLTAPQRCRLLTIEFHLACLDWDGHLARSVQPAIRFENETERLKPLARTEGSNAEDKWRTRAGLASGPPPRRAGADLKSLRKAPPRGRGGAFVVYGGGR